MKSNPNLEFDPLNIENRQIIDTDPTATFMTTKIQLEEPIDPKETSSIHKCG
jgi:hypothetical protein